MSNFGKRLYKLCVMKHKLLVNLVNLTLQFFENKLVLILYLISFNVLFYMQDFQCINWPYDG